MTAALVITKPAKDHTEECSMCGDAPCYQHPDGALLCHYCAGFVREEYGTKCTPLVDAQSCGTPEPEGEDDGWAECPF